MLGRRYDAATLERWNVINRVVPDEELDVATMVLAQELAHGPTIAHAATKRLVAFAINDGVATADEAMAEIQRPIFGRAISGPACRPTAKKVLAWRLSTGGDDVLPLTGIRVVDFSRVLAGPHCAKTLLDLGADVVKIEPPSGDLSRKAFPNNGEISGYYAQQNAGKRNLSIDLNVEGAREIVAKLCDRRGRDRREFPTGRARGVQPGL